MRRILAFALLGVVAQGWAQGPAPGPTKGSDAPKKQGPQTDAAKQDRKPSVPLSVPGNGAGPAAHADDSRQKKDKPSQEWWTIPSALGPVIIGAATLIVIAWQAAEMRKLNKLTKQSADAATKSAEVAEQALTLSDRPWLTILAPKLVHQALPGSMPGQYASRIEVGIANAGRSPAMLKRYGVRRYSGTLPPPLRIIREVFTDRVTGLIVPNGALGMDGVGIQYSIPMVAKEYLAIGVSYRDAFGMRHRSICVMEFSESSLIFAEVRTPGYSHST